MSLIGQSGRVHFVNQMTLCELRLIPILLSPTPTPSCPRCQKRIRCHPEGPRVGAVPRDAVKDPDSLCLLALPCFIFGLLPHGHKKAATTASISCSHNDTENHKGANVPVVCHGTKSWITYYSKTLTSTGNP